MFSHMVFNGTIGGINTLVIKDRDNAKIILGGRIREGRWVACIDFPNTPESFLQEVCQKRTL